MASSILDPTRPQEAYFLTFVGEEKSHFHTQLGLLSGDGILGKAHIYTQLQS